MGYLLEQGAELDAQDETGDTALLNAARYGHARCLQVLLARGAKHTVKNHTGEDLMSLAVDSDNDHVLKVLGVGGIRGRLGYWGVVRYLGRLLISSGIYFFNICLLVFFCCCFFIRVFGGYNAL